MKKRMRVSRGRRLWLLLVLSLLVVGMCVFYAEAGREKKEEAVTEGVVVTGNSAETAVAAAKKYSGITLNVMWEGGLQSEDPLVMGPKWEELTGIKINVVQMGFTDIYANVLQDHLTGIGSYDVITFSPQWTIDFANAGAVEPLNPYIDKYMNKADLEDYVPIYKADGYARLGDTWYGLPDDGDMFLLYYRKDLIEDPENKKEFKTRYGYDLAPPKDWDAFEDIGNFITDKYAPEIYGGGIQRSAGENYDWWTGIFSGYGGQFFDTKTMKPLINSDAGVKALQAMVDQNKWGPPGVETWGFMEVLTAWLDGKIAMAITWPPIGRWSAGLGTETAQLGWVPKSKVIGKVGFAPMPGGRPSHAGGFSLAISPDSKNKEAAYLFIQWMNSPEISLERVMLPYALRDPFRISHFESQEYNNLWDNADEYLNALLEAADNGQMLLGMPAAREYNEAIDNACTAAYAGGNPKAELDKAAKRWEEITNRMGRDSQKEAYNLWREGPWNKEGKR
jgi:multiple sugar transport system substrate-binding protein